MCVYVSLQEGTLLRAYIKYYNDKTYEWELKTPPSTWLLMKAAGLVRGADKAGHEIAGTVSLKHIFEIAKIKQKDMPGKPLESICKNLLHTCRSMGVRVVARPEDA